MNRTIALPLAAATLAALIVIPPPAARAQAANQPRAVPLISRASPWPVGSVRLARFRAPRTAMRPSVSNSDAFIIPVPGRIAVQGAAASSSPPDFSGVYYPVQQGRGGRGQQAGAPAAPRGAPPPRPTQSAPVSDGSQGRSPNAPSLTPEYVAKWEMMRKSRMSGSYEFDNNAKCLPPGMPAMMSMPYGMEIMQARDKITFFSELNDALRRVYLDGRTPTQKHLDDPTYAGYSTGHWEGDTLVVETVALHPDSFIEGFTPHSEEMTVRERIRFIEPGVIEDRITVYDPKALTKPWETVRTYRRANPPNDELREFACAEGLTRELFGKAVR